MKNKYVYVIIIIVILMIYMQPKKTGTEDFVQDYIWGTDDITVFMTKANAWLESTEYVIVTTTDVEPYLSTLISYRSQEYAVQTITVDGMVKEDIMNEINSYNPSYVLIVGTELSVPSDSGSDNYYADTDSDGLPDRAVGRIPTTDSGYISNVIVKTINYETTQQYDIEDLLLVAGSEAIPPTGWQTATFWENNVVPVYSGWDIDKVYCYCQGTTTNCADNKQMMIDSLNEGQTFGGYIGHNAPPGGFMMGCDSSHSFKAEDVDLLTNTIHPIFIALSCTTVNFYDAQTWLANRALTDNNGFVAFIGAHQVIGPKLQYIFTFMLTEDTLGDAFMLSKQMEGVSASTSYQLLGDPALKLK